MSSRRWVAVASLVAATAFCAGNYVVGRSAVAQLSPVSLVWWLGTRRRTAAGHRAPGRAAALAGGGAALALTAGAERPRPGRLQPPAVLRAAAHHAFNASLINAFNPEIILVASVVILRAPLRARGVLGLVVALLGVLLVLTDGARLSLLSVGRDAGDMLMLGAITSWTAYTVVGRLAPRRPRPRAGQ